VESTPYLLPNTQGRYVTVAVTGTSGEVYRINDDGTRTIYADYFVENGNTVLEVSTFASEEFQRNVAEGSQNYNQTIGNSIIQASGATSPQTPAPNPDEQGGSTPVSPTSSSAAPASIMLRYPLTMDDGQDKIKFVPLEIKKVDFSEGSEISIKRPTYQQVNGSSPIFIGIQGNISDSNAVSWGSGELNEIQKSLVNFSLDFMNDPNNAMGDLQKRLEDAFKNKAILSTARGLGQLYFAEQATGVGGLLSRTSGQILNPNLELLFQNPTLRTFQFQFKMSPRNKSEADTVKKIIKEFKRNMAVKNEGLFLKAPNVFKIQYLKGTEVHNSLNLIKVCALLNFSVDYTPNGSYMTFGGGDNGDPEASMVTYVLSMAFQEIEPIYQSDYEKFKYGDGDNGGETISNHPIGA